MIINEALDNLVDNIRDSNIYKKYNNILEKVEHNQQINLTVNDIKKIQKKIVKEKYALGNKSTMLEKSLEEKKAVLYSIPLYQDYIEAANDLNDLMKNVNNRLQTYINGLEI
ncbi:MAG: YlbF family regulator [Bacilli bacterium]|nr:YlbF family regulator [Bacilli bacterium]MDD3304769.1 YlbF family regulator [Bacilli bacterium]MDD4053791.1 YlbF family regulator [Bacilli bacterium]MDD4411635.1 YlbF family regulator [Bacilli bacterium]